MAQRLIPVPVFRFRVPGTFGWHAPDYFRCYSNLISQLLKEGSVIHPKVTNPPPTNLGSMDVGKMAFDMI